MSLMNLYWGAFMNYSRVMVVMICVIVTQGCASTGANYRPLVDTKGVDFNRFEADLGDCQQYARRVAGAGTSGVAGAVAGAALGALLSKVAGGSYDVGAGARIGAVAGGVSGASSGEQDQRSVIRRCLSGRGYTVLR
jgi:outer membrane lipoprotein SlyB